MLPSLNHKVALVTGGSRGLGLAMAEALLEAQCRVAITGHHEPNVLQELEAQVALRLGPNRLLGVRADVCSSPECETAIRRTVRHFGRIDILVNNAGRFFAASDATGGTIPTKFWETPSDEWRTVVDTNLNGAFFMARAAAPYMIERGFGRIINISANWTSMIRNGYGSYGPSKAALEASTGIWARDLLGTGVTCNALLPGGASDTRMSVGLPSRHDRPLLSANVMRAPVVWLSSDLSGSWTGRRFVASNWDTLNDFNEAAARAASPPCELPRII